MPESAKSESTINRRSVLQAVGAFGTASLAGCQSGDGTQELGERVPEITMPYWSDMGSEYTTVYEDVNPVVEEAFNALGMSVSLEPMSISANISDMTDNQRSFPITWWGQSFGPNSVDPLTWMRDFVADEAVQGGGNWPGYINCEYSHYGYEQQFAESREERQRMVNEGQEIYNEDAVQISVCKKVHYSAHHERIDPGPVGDLGITDDNMRFLIESDVTSGENVMVVDTNQANIERLNPQKSPAAPQNKILNSPLVMYHPESNELEGVLAENWERTNDGKTLTFELRDGATFHNGDPVTAEDVAWTYEFVFGNPEAYYWVLPIPFPDDLSEAFEVVDEKTVRFHTTRPYPPLLNVIASEWGIIHSESWIEQGAPDGAGSFEPDPAIGSGPMQIAEARSGQFWAFEPHDGHPFFDVEHELVLRAFQDAESRLQAFINEETDTVVQTTVSRFERLSDVDHAVQNQTANLGLLKITPMFSFGPFKQKPLRIALGTALNRQKINELGYRGQSEIDFTSTNFLEGNPWRPPDEYLRFYTDDPTGETERARQILEDAGFGWDDDDNLHFPPDADLEPLFAADEVPDIPCLDDEGNYVRGHLEDGEYASGTTSE